jgi:hypothetical protein
MGRIIALTNGRRAILADDAVHIVLANGVVMSKWRYADFSGVVRRGRWVALLQRVDGLSVERVLLPATSDADAADLEHELRARIS